MLNRLRYAVGAYRCLVCQRWRWLHSARAIAACDNKPLPFRLAAAGIDRLAAHEPARGLVPTASDMVSGDGDEAAAS